MIFLFGVPNASANGLIELITAVELTELRDILQTSSVTRVATGGILHQFHLLEVGLLDGVQCRDKANLAHQDLLKKRRLACLAPHRK